LSAIFWTLGYDTIYGAQDMSEDEIIGLKSTSIKFKNNIKLFLASSYFITIVMISYLFRDNIGINVFSTFLTIFVLSLLYQILIFNEKKPKNCLKIFKFNNFSGLVLLVSILLIEF